MESRLSAGASCQSCQKPFVRVDDWEAPFTISCGHVFCVGCLNVTSSTCRVCGNMFDRGPISRLIESYGNIPRRSSITTSEEESTRIQGEIASINPNTPISRLNHVYTQGRYFLESQPRNLFKSLDVNLNLLEYLLQAKHALLAQNAVVESLTEKIRQEKECLQRRLAAQDRRYMQEINNMRGYLSRADENFKRAAEDVLSLREELDRATESLRTLRNAQREMGSTDATTAIAPTDESFAPTIRVHPASRSPSIASAAAESPERRGELSPLDMSIPRFPQPTGGIRPLMVHRNRSFHSLSSEGAEASPAESLFISPFGSDLAYASDHEGSEYNAHDDHYDSQSDHRSFDLGNSFLNTLVSQAPSVEDEVGNDHADENEDEDDAADDADSIMAMSTTALPILRTPEPSTGLPGFQRSNNSRFWQSSRTLPPTTLRPRPAPFLANLAVLNDLLNDPRDSVTANATILSRAAELLNAGSLARLADNPTSSQQQPVPNFVSRPRPTPVSQGFSMAEMRTCVIEIIARVFVNLASDAAMINRPSPSSLVTADGGRERSEEFSGWLDSLMESEPEMSTNIVPVNSDPPTPPSDMNSNSDGIANLIDFDS